MPRRPRPQPRADSLQRQGEAAARELKVTNHEARLLARMIQYGQLQFVAGTAVLPLSVRAALLDRLTRIFGGEKPTLSDSHDAVAAVRQLVSHGRLSGNDIVLGAWLDMLNRPQSRSERVAIMRALLQVRDLPDAEARQVIAYVPADRELVTDLFHKYRLEPTMLRAVLRGLFPPEAVRRTLQLKSVTQTPYLVYEAVAHGAYEYLGERTKDPRVALWVFGALAHANSGHAARIIMSSNEAPYFRALFRIAVKRNPSLAREILRSLTPAARRRLTTTDLAVALTHGDQEIRSDILLTWIHEVSDAAAEG